MKIANGKYKNHSFEVITSKSIYELIKICPDTEQDINAEMERVVDEAFSILKEHKLTEGYYPIIFNFKNNSKKIHEQIIQNKEIVEDLDDYIKRELGIPTKRIDDLEQYVVNKMGGDLVKWDTGFIGYVGYDNYGVCSGLEIIPVNTR